MNVFGPDRENFEEWCEDTGRDRDREALADFLKWRYPVYYPLKARGGTK